MPYLLCRGLTLQRFAAYLSKAGKRPQAFTRTRFFVCVTTAPRRACARRHIRELRLLYALPFVPRTYFTEIRRILCRKQLCPSPTPYRRLTAFIFFYMIRAGSFCSTSLYRRARNHKAERNLSALSGLDNCSHLPRAERTSTPPFRFAQHLPCRGG